MDPQVLLQMLLIGYLYGITSKRRLCEEVVEADEYPRPGTTLDALSNPSRKCNRRHTHLSRGSRGIGRPSPTPITKPQ